MTASPGRQIFCCLNMILLYLYTAAFGTRIVAEEVKVCLRAIEICGFKSGPGIVVVTNECNERCVDGDMESWLCGSAAYKTSTQFMRV